MSKIIVQAGHEGRLTGATGAPNEMSFNTDVSNQVAFELSKRGFTVQRVNADPKPEEIAGDWDLFLAIHYDADIYGSGGFFVDTPLNDGAAEKSQKIAYLLRQEYGGTTGIVFHPERRNQNTWDYYMWKLLSWNTPCVLIECGVGMHVPDDHSVLHLQRHLVVEGIVKGICLAFNVPYTMPEPPITPTPPVVCPPDLSGEVTALKENIVTLTDQRNKYGEIILGLKTIIYGKWTWTGTRGWKNRLTQLKNLL